MLRLKYASYREGQRMPEDIKNIFISHVSEDDKGLDRLKKLCDKHGLDVRDSSITSDKPNNAKDPDYIKNEILRPHIKWCSVLVVYVSEKTKDSPWVSWEIDEAERQGKRIVGVWAHGHAECEVPEALGQFGDAMVGWSGESIVNAICSETSEWYQPDGAPADYRSIKRYSC